MCEDEEKNARKENDKKAPVHLASAERHVSRFC